VTEKKTPDEFEALFRLSFAMTLNAMCSKSEQAFSGYKKPSSPDIAEMLKMAAKRATIMLPAGDSLVDMIHHHSGILTEHSGLTMHLGMISKEMEDEQKSDAIAMCAAGNTILSMLAFITGVGAMCSILDCYFVPECVDAEKSEDVAKKASGEASDLIGDAFTALADELEMYHDRMKIILAEHQQGTAGDEMMLN
jgi:hypothetical protein